MKSAELRRRYLDFFQKKNHRLFRSDSLVPEGDASILFTGAGMNQFKDAFLGKGPPDLKRATSCQKCIRMPDLDNVGRTPSHHTFFEMLGNFSFGDYFKRDAIHWAIEFLEKDLGLPRERLAVTVFLDDDEAAAIWEKEVGFPKDRIFRYGEKDNFWPAEAPSKGPNGPCGPCSEIYFDWGTARSTVKSGPSEPGTDGGRFLEIWNLVFTQFDRREGGVLQPLPQKNIDTGAGLERITRVLQEKPTNFETDLFLPIIERVGAITGRRYGADRETDVRMKRIADHVRAASFCIADGVRPSNEGRGYVVRKVVRRAGMDLKELGATQPGLAELVPVIANIMGDAYPELRERTELIQDTIRGDEERFGEVYRAGSERLAQFLAEPDVVKSKRLSGEKAFFLWDTVGFPFDITKRYCEDKGVEVDEAAFDAAMEAQRTRAREGSQIAGEIFDTGPAARLKGKVAPTTFTGYDALKGDARVVALLDASGASVQSASGVATVVLDRSPFYGESGGQVGDTGEILASGGAALAKVTNTAKAEGYHLHAVEIAPGKTIQVGDSVVAAVDTLRRADVMRNHTATHLLHWALRRVVGADTTQAGSLVHPDYLRFDYTAKRAPTEDDLRAIEDLVNGQTLRDIAVTKVEKTFDEAKQSGAIALFGEKYGDRVRVVSVADRELAKDFESVELCGGTHCDRTGQIGLFKIASDGAIAAGVRRIVAVTGRGAIRFTRDKTRLAKELTDLLKTREEDLPARVQQLLDERSKAEKELAKAKRGAALSAQDEILARGVDLGGGTLFTHQADGLGPDELRSLADQLLAGRDTAVAVLCGLDGDKVTVVVACGKGAIQKGVKAGDLCKQLAKALGGGGGGRPELAQGQGANRSALPAALAAIEAAARAAFAR